VVLCAGLKAQDLFCQGNQGVPGNGHFLTVFNDGYVAVQAGIEQESSAVILVTV
jgi:hypothetical protein